MQGAIADVNRPIALLTHAPNDLMVLQSAQAQMPEGFPEVTGINLQALESDAQMAELLEHQFASANIIVLRVLGRLGSVPALPIWFVTPKTRIALNRDQRHRRAGPELAAASTVSSDVLHQVQAYFQAAAASIWLNCCAIFQIIFY